MQETDDRVEVNISEGQIFVSEEMFEKIQKDQEIKKLLIEINKIHNSASLLIPR